MASATGIFRQTGSFISKLDRSLISAKAFSHRCLYAKICRASFPFCASLSRLRSHPHLSLCQVSNGQSGIANAQPVQDSDERMLPTPMVLIDQDSQPDATVVEISFGDRLGALLDTMKALMALGLDVSNASVIKDASLTRTKFFVRRLDNDRKVEDPELLEKIRLTIISGLLKYHPESSECLAMGEAFGTLPPRKKPNMDTATHIHIKNDGRRSILYLETADRPGLLLELMKIMIDSNLNVESAEIDTEGFVAKDKFYVSYRGSALTKPVAEVLINSLRYYLRRPETDIDSY